jgi:hypothetical protein
MTRRSDFSEAEWETMQNGVAYAGLLVSRSERGMLGTLKAGRALARHVADARNNSASELVREIATLKPTGLMPAASSAGFEERTYETLRESVAMLQAKAPEEVDAYRSFVVELAEAVAGAAERPGHIENAALDLLGVPEASEGGESAVLERIRSALLLPSSRPS